jgi:proteasome assembly chaperone (PAC2) family protein
MNMDHVEFDRDPPTNLTTMVMAYGGWIDAGQAATGALRHLVRDLSAARVARIDPEQFFVFTQERPEVKMRDDGNRDIYWPRSEFFACHPWEGQDGLLLFCGPEPHQRWRSYTKAFLDIAGRSVLESWGIYRRPTYEGPTGISTILLDAAERRGISNLGFMGQAPHYLQNGENPAAIQALLVSVARLLHLTLDMSKFAEAIQEFRTQCDKEVARNRATREHVQQLEQQYDATASEEGQAPAIGELDSDKLMQELQDFLRGQREGGPESGGSR